MKAFALFLLRLATGSYLVAWALVKLVSPERAIGISDKFYLGYFSTPAIQQGLGALAAVFGIFVALGFWRILSYPVQALALGLAAAAVAKGVIVTPVDLVNGIEAATLLLPTLAVFLLSVVPLVWWKDDFLTLDRFIDWRLADLSRESSYGAALAAPVAAAAVEAESVEAESVEVEAVEAKAVEVEAEPAAPIVEEEPALAEAAVEAAPIEAAHEDQAAEEEEEIRIDPALAAHAESVDERAAHPVH